MNSSPKLKVLIIHPNNVIAELASFLIESEYNGEAEVVTDLKKAREIFNQSDYPIIVSAMDVHGENAFDFFCNLIDSNKLPLFFIIENKKLPANLSYKNKTPSGVIQESHLLKMLDEEISKVLEKVNDAPKEWTRVSLLPLIHFQGIPADIFIQLSTGRFLKLFSRNDKISEDDVKRYAGKGVKELYLKKQAFQWLIKQIDEVIPAIISNPDGPIVLPEADENTLSPEEYPKMDNPMELEEKLLEELHQTSKKVLLQMKKNQELAKLLKVINVDRTPSAFYRNRIDLVCNISCALARELTWSSDAMFEKLIYVAYTHDLTLMSHPKLARIETLFDLETTPGLTAEEKKLFLNHPKAVAEIVAKDSRAPAEAEMIIRQHHELASSKGFPEGLQSVRILPTAALVEISINFAQYIMDNPKWKFEEYVTYAAPRFRGGPFTKIFKALENMLSRRS